MSEGDKNKKQNINNNRKKSHDRALAESLKAPALIVSVFFLLSKNTKSKNKIKKKNRGEGSSMTNYAEAGVRFESPIVTTNTQIHIALSN